MHLKTHFKVLFNSSKISKTCAHIIFLLNTRHYQELNKIGTITFGSTKLDLHIFESCTQICEKQNKQNKKENLISYWASPIGLGGPRLRAHTAQNGAAQLWFPRNSGGWQKGPARQRPKSRARWRMARKRRHLVGGDFSGGTEGDGVPTSASRIHSTPKTRL